MNLLLEIGTEEIPHWMIPGVLDQLRSKFGSTAEVDATPRRLVAREKDLPERSQDHEISIKGPALAAGPKAAEGFARKHQVHGASLIEADGYYHLRKTIPGVATVDVLSEALPDIINGLQWPKTMYWTAKNGPRFIRPIRWIVALFDDQVIPFEIAGVKSGSITRGHRQLGSSSIPVTIENYETALRRNFVILSSHERRHKIEKEAAGLEAKIDTDLLETLTFITEYPTAIRGEFDPAFLELPAEVLTTVMRHHQKYFSVEGVPGMLAPNFVAVMNTSGDPDGLVRHGNERVLKARFNDARFFWDVDQAKKLEDRVEDLKKVTFQVKIGSYYEKTKRVKDLVRELGGSPDAERAALLCKADLTTEMVKEFTDLQGIVGGLYAKHQGESDAVSRAIYDHYKPLSMDDSIPESKDGQVVALADKLDTLRECFRVGMAPTGSKDPFALRRAAQGVVKILVEARLDRKLEAELDPEAPALFEFLLERAHHYFREVCGFKYDEVNAVLKNYRGGATLADAHLRLSALSVVRPSPNFEPLAASFKRIQNILRQSALPSYPALNIVLLEPGAEMELYNEYERVRGLTKGANYQDALEAIASLRPSIDAFFDKVLVNVSELEIRANRLTLLRRLLTEFSTIADFSEIVTSGDQK